MGHPLNAFAIPRLLILTTVRGWYALRRSRTRHAVAAEIVEHKIDVLITAGRNDRGGPTHRAELRRLPCPGHQPEGVSRGSGPLHKSLLVVPYERRRSPHPAHYRHRRHPQSRGLRIANRSLGYRWNETVSPRNRGTDRTNRCRRPTCPCKAARERSALSQHEEARGDRA